MPIKLAFKLVIGSEAGLEFIKTPFVPVAQLSRPGKRDYVLLTHGQVRALAAEAGRWHLLVLSGTDATRPDRARHPQAASSIAARRYIDFARRRIDVRRVFSDVGVPLSCPPVLGLG